MSYLPAWITYRRYAAATTAMTTVLVALGVYTAATGSGLACEAQWPLCSDRLIPALAINPDFIEWFHRAWAMVTGFLIVGLAAWSWLGGEPRRTRLAATLSVAILPVQIAVGAVTVTVGGLVPGGYTVSTHAAHLIVALTIFTLLGLTTLWSGPTGRGPGPRLLRYALGVGVGGLLAGALFSRAVPLFTYSPGAQAAYYAISLVGYLGLLAVVVHAIDVGPSTAGPSTRVATGVRTLAGVALALLFVTLLLGRDLVLYTGFWVLVNRLALGGAVLAAAAATWLITRDDTATPSRTEPTAPD